MKRSFTLSSDVPSVKVEDQLAWVVEYDNPPWYWTGNGLSHDHMLAARFIRRQDADKTLDHLKDAFPERDARLFHVVEHLWTASEPIDPERADVPSAQEQP